MGSTQTLIISHSHNNLDLV